MKFAGGDEGKSVECRIGSVRSHASQIRPSRWSGGLPVKMWVGFVPPAAVPAAVGSWDSEICSRMDASWVVRGRLCLRPAPPSRARPGSRGRILNMKVW